MTRDELALAVERTPLEAAATTICCPSRTLGLSRRGAAVDRRGGAAADHVAPRRRAARLGDRGRARRASREVRPAALARRHAGRGARPVLRDAGAAEVPEVRARRGRGDRARWCAAWRSRRPDVAFTLAGDERAPVDLGSGAARRRPGGSRGWRRSRRASSRRMPSPSRRSARGCGCRASPACRPSTAANARSAVPVRQRPAGARPAAASARCAAAYADFLARDRHPVAALFSRSDAARGRRQRASGQDRGALPRCRAGARADRRRAAPCAGARRGIAPRIDRRRRDARGVPRRTVRAARRRGTGALAGAAADALGGAGAAPASPRRAQAGVRRSARRRPTHASRRRRPRSASTRPLGAARAQLHETYIVAQTRDGIVIVDQHAAHERLVYERMKAELRPARRRAPDPADPGGGRARPRPTSSGCCARADELAQLGLVIEPFGPGAVVVRETPALLGEIDARRWSATSPTTWPNGTRRCRSRGGSSMSPRPWPATARCAPAGGSSRRR